MHKWVNDIYCIIYACTSVPSDQGLRCLLRQLLVLKNAITEQRSWVRMCVISSLFKTFKLSLFTCHKDNLFLLQRVYILFAAYKNIYSLDPLWKDRPAFTTPP